MRYRSLADALQDPDLFASSALLIVVDQFGQEALDWEPETLTTEIADKFAVSPTPLLMDKINAAMGLLTTNLFYQSLEAFTAVCRAFSNSRVTSDRFNLVDLDEVMWGLVEARLLEGGEEFDKAVWGTDIRLYVGTLLSQEGVGRAPQIMRFAMSDPVEQERRDMVLSSDLTLAEAYWRRNDEQLAELEGIASSRLDELFQQVESLPLANRAEARKAISQRLAPSPAA